MELEQDWWKGSLAKEIHSSLLQKECKLPQFSGQSPQLMSRRCLVDWLAVICDRYHICRMARHLAVALLDYFMDRFVIVEEKLKLVGLGCLLVAAKFEEQEIKIPKASELNRYITPPGYTMATYLKMELVILDAFDWRINLPTAAHFVDYFMIGCLDNDDINSSHPITETELKSYLEKYTEYFLEISLQDYFYREYKPSLVCAACIASSRICLPISPPWTDQLQKITQYTWQDLQPLIQVMLRTHSLDKNPSQGNLSLLSTMSLSSSSPVTPPTPNTPMNPMPLINQVPNAGVLDELTPNYNYNTQGLQRVISMSGVHFSRPVIMNQSLPSVSFLLP